MVVENTQNENRLFELFDELVPPSGKCESLAGELLRAVNKILYRHWNDGDHIGVGYGNETCNAPARFLISHGNEDIKKKVRSMWGTCYSARSLDALVGMVVDYVETHPQFRQEPTADMLDYLDDEDYEY